MASNKPTSEKSSPLSLKLCSITPPTIRLRCDRRQGHFEGWQESQEGSEGGKEEEKEREEEFFGFKNSSFIRPSDYHNSGILSIRGTSSPSDDSSSAANDLELDDCASLFGLGRKDLTRPAGSIRLDDLTCRQLGFAVSNVVEAVTPSDIFEIGGELAARLNSLFWFLLRVMSC